MTKYIIPHKNPDTDAICASIMLQKLLKARGTQAIPIRLGELNNETKFILEKLNIETPKLKTEFENGTKLYLVDHNEAQQSIENLNECQILGIYDHHKFKLETSTPLEIRAEPLGSTNSILAKIFFEQNIELSQKDAKILISAILSDTLLFNAPTTTKEDKEIVEKLNKIAQIENLDNWALEMFNAKSNLGNMDIEKVIKLDYKEFNFKGKKLGIGIMETTSPSYGLSRKNEIIEKMKELKSKDKLDGIFLSIIDILNQKNITIYPEKFEKEMLSEALNGKLIEENIQNLGNQTSRKKQIVPALEKYF
ncbi:MAG: manganese-dependent inorganic pyrophosphatase [Nanoarchaeota archaeon]